MSKLTQLEKAIANLKTDREVLDLAIMKLEAQRAVDKVKGRTRKPQLVAGDKASA